MSNNKDIIPQEVACVHSGAQEQVLKTERKGWGTYIIVWCSACGALHTGSGWREPSGVKPANVVPASGQADDR